MLKRIGSVACRLLLLEGSRLHPIFHVSRLKKVLGVDDNVANTSILVDLPPSLTHESKHILDIQKICATHSVWREYLVKWKDRVEEGSTYEKLSTH